MDFEAYFPSADVDFAAERIEETVVQSEVDVRVDTEALALFVACSNTQEEISARGLELVVHQRRYTGSTRPGMKCAAITGGPKARDENDSWIPPKRRPGCRQIKKMLGMAIKYMVKMVMKNHFYMVGNEIRRQRRGGAIGNRLTGEMCRNFGKWWDKQLLSKMRKLKIELELYKRYVDDSGVFMKGLDPGVRYNIDEDKMEVKNEHVETDKSVPEDERTMREFEKIASNIHP